MSCGTQGEIPSVRPSVCPSVRPSVGTYALPQAGSGPSAPGFGWLRPHRGKGSTLFLFDIASIIFPLGSLFDSKTPVVNFFLDTRYLIPSLVHFSLYTQFFFSILHSSLHPSILFFSLLDNPFHHLFFLHPPFSPASSPSPSTSSSTSPFSSPTSPSSPSTSSSLLLFSSLSLYFPLNDGSASSDLSCCNDSK